METMQRALNTSFHPQEQEVAFKETQKLPDQVTRYPIQLDSKTEVELGDENTQKPEEFCIDDLLDFSNQQLFQLQQEEEHQTEEVPQQPKELNILSSPQNYSIITNNSSVTDDFSSICVPVEDLENLEWLSQFVEDSFCESSLTYPPGKLPPFSKTEQHRSEPDGFMTPVRTKARSKRIRSGLRVWPSLTQSEPEPEKKLKKIGGTQETRQCRHCGVQKTPQWRAGPLGLKTLCNACGVRFKSGRLLPEYRPACSPTFSDKLHSNSHRKVLEMRRKKEVKNGVGSF